MSAGGDRSFWRLVARWPRWTRVLVAWGALLVSLPTMILVLDAVASRLGLSSCGRFQGFEQPWICGDNGRLTLLVTSLLVCLPLVFLWTRFLTRFSSTLTSSPRERREGASCEAIRLRDSEKRLPLRQVYLSGELRVLQCGGKRTLTVAEKQLTIAGDGSRHFDGWTRGCSAEVVCQLVPGSPDLRLLMAARFAGEGPIYAFGVGAQSAAVLLALLCMAWFGVLSPQPSAVWTILCGLLAVASLSYLVLARRARRSLEQMRRPPPLQ